GGVEVSCHVLSRSIKFMKASERDIAEPNKQQDISFLPPNLSLHPDPSLSHSLQSHQIPPPLGTCSFRQRTGRN
ncbi:hypothetical protein M378DRAFT_165558, partial [Amanita muscaria Koide BX008]